MMKANNDSIKQLLLDEVEAFDAYCSICADTAFDLDAYNSDHAFRSHFDLVTFTSSFAAVAVAYTVFTYKDQLIFPQRMLTICTIEGDFNVFYDLFAGALNRVLECDRSIRSSRSECMQIPADLFSCYGHAVRNLSSCAHFLACYVSSVVDSIHVKIDSC